MISLTVEYKPPKKTGNAQQKYFLDSEKYADYQKGKSKEEDRILVLEFQRVSEACAHLKV